MLLDPLLDHIDHDRPLRAAVLTDLVSQPVEVRVQRALPVLDDFDAHDLAALAAVQ